MGVRDRNFWSALNQKRKVSAHLFWDFDYCGVATFFLLQKKKKKLKYTIHVLKYLKFY